MNFSQCAPFFKDGDNYQLSALKDETRDIYRLRSLVGAQNTTRRVREEAAL